METAWFVLIAAMLGVYLAADGFDLGAGILYPLVARNEDERTALRATIGHIWGANEVWLIALGGVLFLAFPKVYATSFSGFYLALMVLLWCLIGRGLSLEVRPHLDEPVWRSACDILFPVASLLIAAVLGTAAGNVLRGVPIDAKGMLFLPLWTNLLVGSGQAILDWYTLTLGLLAVAAFVLHGANYLALKTEGELRARAARWAARAQWPTGVLALAGFGWTPLVNPQLLKNYQTHPAAYAIVGLAAAALVAGSYVRRRARSVESRESRVESSDSPALNSPHATLNSLDFAAFAASTVFILSVVACAAFALFPNLLPATGDPARSLSIYNAAAARYGLTVGMIWFAVGMGLVGLGTAFTYRLFAERVRPGRDHY